MKSLGLKVLAVWSGFLVWSSEIRDLKYGV